MTITAAASLVGANTAVKAAMTTVKATRAATRVGRAANAAKTVYRNTAAAVKRVVGRCNSFSPETLVLLADGTYHPISQIKVDDLVAATDPESGETTAEPVIAVLVAYETKHMVEIDTDLDPLTSGIRATAYHPFWVEGRGWTDAGNLIPGDQLLSPDGLNPVVSSIVDEGELPEQLVFNLNVGSKHTFVIRDEAGDDILVHNSACGFHGNSLKCTCPNYIYSIYKNGSLFKYGEGKGYRVTTQPESTGR